MLHAIKQFFMRQPIATLAQVATAIDTDPETTRLMLIHFENKGLLICLSQPDNTCTTGGSSSCQGCPASGCQQTKTASLLYQWQPH